MPTALLNAAEAVMQLGDPELAARVMGAADASLEKFPINTWLRTAGQRNGFAERLPSRFARLERLRQEGAGLTLEEAVLRVAAFRP